MRVTDWVQRKGLPFLKNYDPIVFLFSVALSMKTNETNMAAYSFLSLIKLCLTSGGYHGMTSIHS
jgi:hypothetical protein